MKYVLITSARNEEAFIAKALDSVVKQTVLPERWIIVDDNSTDRTANIIQDYAERFPWIELVRRHQSQDRNFASKAHARCLRSRRTPTPSGRTSQWMTCVTRSESIHSASPTAMRFTLR